MIIPSPSHGLVIRHAFLWSHEKAAGQDEGRKDRPAVIVLVVKGEESGELRVVVVPITHSPPASPDGGVQLTDGIKRSLGLDADPQWVLFGEINRFTWPGFDLRPVPGTASPVYGALPADFFLDVLRGVRAHQRGKKVRITDRD